MQSRDLPRDTQPQSQTGSIVMLPQLERAKHIPHIVRLDFPPGIGDIDLDPHLGQADTDADHPAERRLLDRIEQQITALQPTSRVGLTLRVGLAYGNEL